MNSRKGDISNVDVHRASYVKHLKKMNGYLENLLIIKSTKNKILNH